MKRKLIILTILSCSFIYSNSFSQRSYIRSQIKKDVEKKVAEPHKEKGVKAIDDITYENDKRFQNFKNTTPATLNYKIETLDKNGANKKTTFEEYVFGSNGECIVLNKGEKQEQHMIFNYVDKANYIVSIKDMSATKMPIISFQKKIEESNKQPLNSEKNWTKTNEQQTISGFVCRKYVYSYDNGTKADMWITDSKVINLNGHMLYASQFKGNVKSKDANVPKGFLVQSTFYNKKGIPETRRTLVQATPKADEKFFDMTQYKVNDVVDMLR